MRSVRKRTVLVSTLLALVLTQVARADDKGSHPAVIGDVHFKVECNATAQAKFNVAVAYYHSFQWQRVIATADDVLKVDPTCGMAHWVKALAMLDNPFAWPVTLSEKAIAEGPVLLDAARKAGLKTQRERDYVDALAIFFKDLNTTNYRERAESFEKRWHSWRNKMPTTVRQLYCMRSFSQETSIPLTRPIATNYTPPSYLSRSSPGSLTILE